MNFMAEKIRLTAIVKEPSWFVVQLIILARAWDLAEAQVQSYGVETIFHGSLWLSEGLLRLNGEKSEPPGNRTQNLMIKSHLLCQLS